MHATPMPCAPIPFAPGRSHDARYTLYFHHVPKCAGTTCIDLLQRNTLYVPCHFDTFSRLEAAWLVPQLEDHDGPLCVAGHGTFGLERHIPTHRPVHLFTMLRDPWSLFRSHYRYERNNYRPVGSMDAFLDTYAPNPLVHWLGDGDADAARARLEREYAVFGLVEAFDRSMALLCDYFGFTSTFHAVRNISRPAQEAGQDDALRAAFEERNAEDRALYGFARELFETRAEAMGIEAAAPAVASVRDARSTARTGQTIPDRLKSTDPKVVAEAVQNIETERLRAGLKPMQLTALAGWHERLGNTRQQLDALAEACGVSGAFLPDYCAALAATDPAQARALLRAAKDLPRILDLDGPALDPVWFDKLDRVRATLPDAEATGILPPSLLRWDAVRACARTLAERNDSDRAVALLERAAGLDTPLFDAAELKAQQAFILARNPEATRHDEADAVMKQTHALAPSHHPGRARTLMARAELLRMRGKADSARTMLEEALKTERIGQNRPGVIRDLQLALGHVLDSAGEHEAALDIFLALQQRIPGHWPSAQAASALLRRLGRATEAADLLREHEDLFRVSAGDTYHFEWIPTLYMAGDAEGARRAAERLRESDAIRAHAERVRGLGLPPVPLRDILGRHAPVCVIRAAPLYALQALADALAQTKPASPPDLLIQQGIEPGDAARAAFGRILHMPAGPYVHDTLRREVDERFLAASYGAVCILSNGLDLGSLRELRRLAGEHAGAAVFLYPVEHVLNPDFADTALAWPEAGHAAPQ